jgi:hypothetical protein
MVPQKELDFMELINEAQEQFYLYSGIRGGLISLWLYKENNKLRDKKCIYYTYPP